MSNNASHDYDVIILGAGAAGLLCAITAANRGRRVLVLEKANKIGKKIIKFMPNSNKMLNNIKPRYLILDGWCANTIGIKNKKMLPQKAQKFIKVIENILNIPINFLSNGPDRNDIINLKKIT